MINVLHITSGLSYGGISLYLLNLCSQFDFSDISFNFLITEKKTVNPSQEEKLLKFGNICYLDDCSTFFKRQKSRKKFFKEHKNEFDIVHIHTVYSTAWGVAKIAKKHGIVKKVIIHSHAACDFGGKKLKNDISRFNLNRYSDCNLACSKSAGEFLFGKNKSFAVAYNGINFEKFRFDENARDRIRNELDLSETEKVLMHVGRFVQEKNHFFIIDVFKEYIKRFGKITLVLVGDGALKSDVIEYAKTNNVDHLIKFVGAKPNVFDYLSASDCFILPSLSEALPISAIEAAVNGLDVIITSGLSEELDSFEAVQKEDLNVDKWVLKINEVLNNPKDRNRIIENNEFDARVSAEKLKRIYLSLI